MKKQKIAIVSALTILLILSCNTINKASREDILFLHHSTGRVIWNGDEVSKFKTSARKLYSKLGKGELPILFKKYNREHKTKYSIESKIFPKNEPYGWNNFPYDYYNIWVKNAGDQPYMEEPTLEMLTKKYDVIIFKHCYPVSNIKEDLKNADINSDIKTIANYKLQYNALRKKLHEFPNNKFILFTGAAQLQSKLSQEEALRAKEFFTWVRNEWDLSDDNIFLWDLYELQTEGGLYLKNSYAVSDRDSHPNPEFASFAVKKLFNRIIDVIENNGTNTSLTGEPISK